MEKPLCHFSKLEYGRRFFGNKGGSQITWYYSRPIRRQGTCIIVWVLQIRPTTVYRFPVSVRMVYLPTLEATFISWLFSVKSYSLGSCMVFYSFVSIIKRSLFGVYICLIHCYLLGLFLLFLLILLCLLPWESVTACSLWILHIIYVQTENFLLGLLFELNFEFWILTSLWIYYVWQFYAQ